jgi:hypothetical protein
MKSLLTIILLTLSLGAFAEPDDNLVDCSCADAPKDCGDRNNGKNVNVVNTDNTNITPTGATILDGNGNN